jgi:methionyl-tRNA formyltransferase
MRPILVGAVESTLTALETLARQGAPPVAVLTLPPDRAHRHSDWVDLRPAAGRLDIPLVEVTDVNGPDAVAAVARLQPDYAFVVGWSQICRAELLGLPTGGAIGYHPAPLPENRGRGVIPWTILQRRTSTGSSLFWMDEGMDSGDILVQEHFAVAPDETARSLYDKHLAALGRMLAGAVPALRRGAARRVAQDHAKATYCARRTPDDGHVDWRADAEHVWTLVRASGDPYPGAFSFLDAQLVGAAPYWGQPGQVQALGDGGALVQCGDGQHVLLRTVQREDDERRPAAEVLRVHQRLGVDWLRLVRPAP